MLSAILDNIIYKVTTYLKYTMGGLDRFGLFPSKLIVSILIIWPIREKHNPTWLIKKVNGSEFQHLVLM